MVTVRHATLRLREARNWGRRNSRTRCHPSWRLAWTSVCLLAVSACTALGEHPLPSRSPQGYVTDSSGRAALSSDGECVRTGFWLPSNEPCSPRAVAVAPPSPPVSVVPSPALAYPPPAASAAPPSPAYPPAAPGAGEGFNAPRVAVPRVTTPLPEVKVYYATDRSRTGNPTPAAFYGDTPRKTLELGIAYVTIPLPVHTRGEFEEPKWWKFEFKVNPAKHVYLRSVSPFLNTNDFYTRLRQDVSARKGKEMFVFVHGFNVGFDEAARRTAQIAYDLDLDMVPVLFSWTSRGKLLRYGSDEDMSDKAVHKLYPFLQTLAQESGAESIHLVAHSLGNRFLARALNMLDVAKAFEKKPLFNQIVMAAPDIQLSDFEDIFAASIQKSSCRTTLYFSKEDKALWISAFKHDNRRLGANSPLVRTDGWLDTIDASSVDISLLGINHSYYGTRQVLEDMKQVLRRVATPRRLLVRTPGAASSDYWKFEAYRKGMPVIDKAAAPKVVLCR